MSELNVAAVLTPKPENFDEVRMILHSIISLIPYLSPIQVAALVTEVTKQVQEHEPDTLLYYAFPDKTEIIIVERPVHYLSSQVAMANTFMASCPCLGSNGRRNPPPSSTNTRTDTRTSKRSRRTPVPPISVNSLPNSQNYWRSRGSCARADS